MTGNQRPSDSTQQLTQRLDIDFALEAAGLGVWELDPLTNQVFWDDRCRQLFGLSKHNNLPYEQAIQYIYPDDVHRVKQAVQWAMNPQSDARYDETYRTIGADDGQLRWVRCCGKSYFSDAGTVYRFAGIAQEVTHQVLAQQREATTLHQTQRQQRIHEAITASTPDLMYVFDLSYRFIYANQALLDMWGSSWEKSIGKSLLENGYEPWHAQMHEREIDQVVATRQSIRGEVSFPHATLGNRVYDYVFAPVLNEAGEVEAVTGTTRDITDSKQAQALIQESEARFRSLIEEAPVATMLLVGPEHTINIANEVMIHMLGKGLSIVGQPLTDVLPELATEAYLHLLNQVVVSGTVHEVKAMPGELVINGVPSRHYFDFTVKPLWNSAGQVYGIISMAMDVTQQVLAQHQAAQNQRELLALFEQSPVGLATLSADDALVFQWANLFYGQLVARKPEEIVGKPLLTALPEIKGQGFDEILKNVIATGTPFIAPEVEVDILRDGQLSTIYVDLTYQPQKGADGVVKGILVVATDVTQQVATRKKVEESETKLRAILATAPAGIGVFVGRDLIIENPNQTFIDIVGKGPDIEGLPLRQAMPELLSEGQSFLQILDDVFTTGKPFISPGSLVKIVQNGELKDNYYNISYSPLRNASGEIYAILDIAIDVTAQLNAQQALAESEAHLELLRDTVPAMIFYLDAQQRYQSYNQVFRQWFGINATEALGKTVREFLGEQAYQLARPHLTRAYAGHQERYELHAPSRMSADRWLSIVYTPHKNQAGVVIGLIVHATDITHNKQIEFDLSQRQAQYQALAVQLEQQVQQRTEELASTNEELMVSNEELMASNEEYAALNEELEEANGLLIRSNDNLQTFAYVASHDLQEPLRKIQQFGDLLKTRYADSVGEELIYLERMQSAASRMSTLIKDLLNYSRISTQRDASGPVALNIVVDRVLTTLELPIQETNARISIEPLPTVQGDASQLGQLFQNLLSNALKFSRVDRQGVPAIPWISITAQQIKGSDLPSSVKPTRLANQYVQINVTDNGVGFDEKYLNRIFQVFQRLHGKNEFAGTGIGLAICEKVVTNHGGAITASSQPGLGATFRVYLPV